MAYEIIEGDCREIMRGMAEENTLVDSIVCDPPYELAFMGKQWDASGVAFDVETWKAAYDILKPGGQLLAFGGSRTYHRLTSAIEDAGFEIRDCIMWLYGSGFPKSYDVAQAIEKLQTTGKSRRPDRDLGGMSRDRFSGAEEGGLIANTGGKIELTTEHAIQWQGWGTALKPAYEPCIVARKPFKGSVAKNVLEHGTGAINIDACRIDTGNERISPTVRDSSSAHEGWTRPWMADRDKDAARQAKAYAAMQDKGRWPANLIHDGSEEVLEAFPSPHGAGAARDEPGGGDYDGSTGIGFGRMGAGLKGFRYGDNGSAARFFYCAKTSKADREEGNTHPTVKPTNLMRYLCRMVTQPGGIVFDPFTGSGSTGKAAVLEGFDFIGAELSPEYTQIARDRCERAQDAQGKL
jgi:DNA modification methylase